MAFNGQIVIDADCHIREYWNFDKTYKDNIDPEYRDKYARFSAAVKANQKRTGDGCLATQSASTTPSTRRHERSALTALAARSATPAGRSIHLAIGTPPRA
jgi:hypothetical protein